MPKGSGKIFYGPEEVRISYDAGEVDLQARIKVRLQDRLVDSTVGRVLLGEVLPPMIPFERINRVMTKKEIRKLIDECYRKAGIKQTVLLADRLKDVGLPLCDPFGDFHFRVGHEDSSSKKGDLEKGGRRGP